MKNFHHITALCVGLQARFVAPRHGLQALAAQPLQEEFGRAFEIVENWFAFATQVC
jgi:hypothetical protein